MNGDFLDESKNVVNKHFRYYTLPSLWDDYRNKLVLLGLLSPDVTVDVIRSLIDRGEKTGFIPTFFHGDHAAAFIAGSYLRGLRGYDVESAYHLLLRNATVEGGTRPFIGEYITNGYVSTPDIAHPTVETKAKAGVTKTLEYAYDDYAVALLAKQLNDETNYDVLMKRSRNYKNVFDPSTELMRGRLANGDWVKNFNPEFPCTTSICTARQMPGNPPFLLPMIPRASSAFSRARTILHSSLIVFLPYPGTPII